ncbi:MAG: LCP family protein [Anaerolineales bacterium]|nr:LCP family protein [Anaerolineales bacterium]
MRIVRNIIIVVLILLVVAAAAALVGWGAYRYARNMSGAIPEVVSGFEPIVPERTTTPGAGDESAFDYQSSTNVNQPQSAPTLTPWDGAGRVTILVLGLDYRDWSTDRDYSRSDTMILLTLDPLTRTAGILSIPRDLWVSIPQFKHGKINTAYYLGDAYKLPGGGAGLAVETVEELLGVPINYYAQIDFGAFVDFIDEIGGVKLDVTEPITIDLLGSGSATKKNLQAGVQVLPGEWALAYARARNTDGGDFDRAARQQQVIIGIRDRILSVDLLSTLIGKADVLYQQLSSGIHTNINLSDAIKLAIVASQVKEKDIQQGIIGKEQVLFGKSPDGLSILIPITDDIHLLRDQIFASSGVLSPQTPGNAQERVQAEAANVSIINQSNDPALGQQTADHLESLGIHIVSVSPGEQYATVSSVITDLSTPYTLSYIVDLMDIVQYRIKADSDVSQDENIILFLGIDWERDNSLP